MTADNEPTGNGGNPPAAGAGGEPHVPKHRLDEVLERTRRLEEDLRLKDQLLERLSAAQQNPRSAEARTLTHEDLGIDEQTFKAAEMIADSKLATVEKKYQGAIAQLANTVEETRFLQAHGKEAAKYLDKIKHQRVNHYRATGMAMDMDTAFKLIRYDELSARAAAPAPQGQTQTTTETATATAAAAQGGGQAAASAPANQAARQSGGLEPDLDESKLDEGEAELDRQITSSGGMI